MKVESIYKHFLVTQVSHIPVVNDKFEVVGLLSKHKVTMEMADLSEPKEFNLIPNELMDMEMSESILFYFQAHTHIPVINEISQRVDSWDKPRFLAEFSRLSKTTFPIVEVKKQAKEEFSENKQAIFHLMSELLSNFPDALFSTDKEGITTFYNEKFETEILTHLKFKDSISLAEKYFSELSKDLIANFLNNHNLKSKSNFPILQSQLKEIGYTIRVIPLKEKESLTGYLFHFIHPEEFILKQNEKGYLFPSLEEAFMMNLPYENLMNEIESRYIYYKLIENDENISHTAEALKIPRSTLQNKIKHLKIYQKFSSKSSSPIPRKQKKVVEKKISKNKKVLDSIPSKQISKKDSIKSKLQPSKTLEKKRMKKKISQGTKKPTSSKKR